MLSANACTGAFPLAEALDAGAQVVIAGRAADPALALAPMIHCYGWKPDDFDRLAAGAVAGHIIGEAEPDGTFTVTKHAAAGGRVNSHVVKEQLVYELGDPRRFMTPDCIADFTSIRVEDSGPDRVRISVAAAPPNPDPPEVQLRIGVRGMDKAAVERFTRELAPLVLNGPPGATGYGEGRPPVREVIAYSAALVPRDEIRCRVTVI